MANLTKIMKAFVFALSFVVGTAALVHADDTLDDITETKEFTKDQIPKRWGDWNNADQQDLDKLPKRRSNYHMPYDDIQDKLNDQRMTDLDNFSNGGRVSKWMTKAKTIARKYAPEVLQKAGKKLGLHACPMLWGPALLDDAKDIYDYSCGAYEAYSSFAKELEANDHEKIIRLYYQEGNVRDASEF